MAELARPLFIAPLFLVAVLSYLSEASSPLARQTVAFLLAENHLVEWLQVVFFVSGSIVAFRSSRLLEQFDADKLAFRFYQVFALGLLFGALEEVSWGQQIFNFTPPAAIERFNRQEELNLHNLPVFFSLFEMLRVSVGLAGLAAMMLPATKAVRYLRAPRWLASWFVLIVIMAGLDLLNQNAPPRIGLFIWAQNLVEVMELLIAGSAFLYVLYNFQLARATLREPAGVLSVEPVGSATLPQ